MTSCANEFVLLLFDLFYDKFFFFFFLNFFFFFLKFFFFFFLGGGTLHAGMLEQALSLVAMYVC